MGHLLDLLKAAKGERSIDGRIGRWRQAVSAALDVAGVGEAAQYINSKNSGAQAGITSNNSIVVDSDINVRGITRPSTTAFELTPGKTYHLSAHATMDTFSDPVAGRLVLRWVDDTNTGIPTTGPDATTGIYVPTTSTDGIAADPVVDVIYTVPAAPFSARLVKLRCIAAQGTATLPANGVSVSIVEIK
jgi:hypothetical protein